MVSLSELWRRTQNMITTAKVVKTMAEDGKLLVQVLYTDKETGEEHLSRFLPMMGKNNSFVKVWLPPLPDEQVTVLRPFGDNDGGVVLPSIFWTGNKEPNGANEHVAIVEFSDGCTIKYDSLSQELSVDRCKTVRVDCDILSCSGDLVVGGVITDALGDLSHFTTSDGATRV